MALCSFASITFTPEVTRSSILYLLLIHIIMGPSPRYEPRPESPLPDGGLADTNSNSAVPWHSTMMSQSPLLGAPFHGYPGTGYAFDFGNLDSTSLHALLSTIPGATHTIPSGPLVDTRSNTASVPSLPMPDPRLGANGSHPPVAPPHSHASISSIHHPVDEPGPIASPLVLPPKSYIPCLISNHRLALRLTFTLTLPPRRPSSANGKGVAIANRLDARTTCGAISRAPTCRRVPFAVRPGVAEGGLTGAITCGSIFGGVIRQDECSAGAGV